MSDTVDRFFAIQILSIVGITLFCFLFFFLTIQKLGQQIEQGSDERDSSHPINARNLNIMNGLQQNDEETGVSLAEMQEIHAQLDRKTLIRSKLHYQIVLPDKSNATIKSLREAGHNGDDDATSTDCEVENEEVRMTHDINLVDDGDNSIIASKHESTASVVSLYHRVYDLFSLRSLRPRKQDICSICLDEFQAGQTICAAKNACCKHTFHLECIRTWLMKNDDCPNCRRMIIE